MKLRVDCMTCAFQGGPPKHIDPAWESQLEVNDDGVYLTTCKMGHSFGVVLQEEKFEILMDFAVMAFLDGYSREAVANIAASLERFFEFCIEVFLEHATITREQFLKTWKQVKNQSERQLGAFIFLYLQSIEESPPALDQHKIVSFRNKVIHQGYIPSAEETREFGDNVISYIHSILSRIRQNCQSAIDKLIGEHNKQKFASIPKGTKPQFLSIPTVIGLTTTEAPKNFSNSLNEIQKWNRKAFTK